MAIVVHSNSELREKLSDFIQRKKNIDCLYHGNCKVATEVAEIFQENDDINQLLAAWMDQKKIHKLAKLWVKGAPVNWRLLYSKIDIAERPNLVDLPGYPFQRKRYWLLAQSRSSRKSTLEASTNIDPLPNKMGLNLHSKAIIKEDIPKVSLPPILNQEGQQSWNSNSLPGKPSSTQLNFISQHLEKKGSNSARAAEVYDHGQGIFRIKVDDSTHGNRLTSRTIDELITCVTTIRQRIEAKVILLTGTESNFLHGGINEYNLCKDADIFSLISGCELPVIAVIKGRCTGVGWLIGILCDFCVYSEASCCHYGHMEHSGIPSREEYELFCQRFSEDFARSALFLCEEFTGLGLKERISQATILPSEKIGPYVKELANSVAKCPRDSLILLKRKLARDRLKIAKNLPYRPHLIYQPKSEPATKLSVDFALKTKPHDPIEVKMEINEVIQVTMKNGRLGTPLSLEALINALEDCFDQIRQHAHIRVVVLIGSDSFFLCADEKRPSKELEWRIRSLLSTFDRPVIAAMKGNAGGLGWFFGLLCDEVIYSESGKYSFFAPHQIHPESSASEVFSARLGNYLGKEILFTGRECSGVELSNDLKNTIIVSGPDVPRHANWLASRWASFGKGELREFKNILSNRIWNRIRHQKSETNPPSRPASIKVNTIQEYPSQVKRCVSERKKIQFSGGIINAEAYTNGVFYIELCDNSHRNMMTPEFLQSLTDVFEHIKEHQYYKVVVLTGFDKYFACGGTKELLLAIQNGTARFTDTNIYSLALECEIPVIAAIQGHAIGAGWAMGMFCDFVILSKESSYISPYMQYGFTPGAGSTLIFPYWLNQDLTWNSLFAARPFNGSELKESGICLPVLNRSEVQPYAMDLANRIALEPRSALIRLKSISVQHLRKQLKATFAEELAMHEKTFVGNKSVLKNIHENFPEWPGYAKTPMDSLSSERESEGQRAAPSHSVEEAEWESVKRTLIDSLAEELHMDPGNVDLETPFVSLGLDSISGVTWVRKINQEFGLNLRATNIYDHHNIHKLTQYVLQERIPKGQSRNSQQISHRVQTGEDKQIDERGRQRYDQPILLSGKEHPNPTLENAPRLEERLADRKKEGIAVIGMGGRFPKAKTLAEFWQNIASNRDCISEVPATRWPVERYFSNNRDLPDKTCSKWMGILEDADRFDPRFFNISPLEAQRMDPQQRVFLESCWQCIEDAAYAPHQLAQSRCGIFVGCLPGDYCNSLGKEGLTAQGFTGSAISILAARVAYFLDLRGPCLTIDTSCSSSLVAIASACDSLIARNCDSALAGGVCVLAGPAMHIMTSQAGMLSPNGRCFTFDQRANGFVPGEGVGVVFLKRLSDAIKDSDPIHGVIQGWGVNQDGKTNGITAPHAEAQSQLQRDIYKAFSIDPGKIQLIEAHGTGTKLGDPIEIEALTKSFQMATKHRHFCAIGALKSNVGHLIGAAGVASVIKVLLAIKHQQLPPTLHFDTANEHINFDESPFYVNTNLKEWIVNKNDVRRAAINSFGFSGTNAHIVIEEFVDEGSQFKDQNTWLANDQASLILLSAKNEHRLREITKNLYDFIKSQFTDPTSEIWNLSNLAFTLQIGRVAMEERLAFVVNNTDELLEKLNTVSKNEGELDKGCYRGSIAKNQADFQDLSHDEDSREMVQKWIRKRKLHKIAKFWVQGLTVDWSQLYENRKAHRIRLPTYPFARERYWLDAGASSLFTSLESRSVPILHPLVHENCSTLHEQCYKVSLTGTEFILQDHKIFGRSVLPGVVHLEMARAAVNLATKKNVHSLKNITFLEPAWADRKIDLFIGLFPQEEERVSFEIFSNHAEDLNNRIIHSQGIAKLNDFRLEINTKKEDILAIKARCKAVTSVQTCYEKYNEVGLFIGSTFQGIESLACGDNELLAELKIPPPLGEEQSSSYYLHPSLFDSALHASIGFFWQQEWRDFSRPFVPFSIEEIQLFRPLNQHCYSYIRQQGSSTKEGLSFDAEIFDRKGKRILQLTGFKGIPIGWTPQPDSDQNQVRTFFIRPEWTASNATTHSFETPKEIHKQVILVNANNGFFDGMVQTFSDVRTLQISTDSQSIINTFHKVVDIIKENVRRSMRSQMTILVVPADLDEFCYAPLMGLLKCVRREHREIQGKIVQFYPSISPIEMAKLLQEEFQLEDTAFIRYTAQRKRMVQHYCPVDDPLFALPPVFKESGVYWIIGGAGRLGQIITEYLAHRYKATIIASGRRTFENGVTNPLGTLQNQGVTVDYFPCNLCDEAAVRSTWGLIKGKYSKINGIIHAAGIQQDSWIQNKSTSMIDTVLCSKITGTMILDEITKNEVLDVMVYFSSIASVTGNNGQSDYAGANAFFDSFARWRNERVSLGERHGKTISINWPLWEDGGMALDEEFTTLYTTTFGLTPLSTQSGLLAFESVLHLDSSQVGVLVSNKSLTITMEQAIRGLNPKNHTKSSPQTAELKSSLKNELNGLVANLLKLDRNEIDDSKGLHSYGFDSILLAKFVNQINKRFKLRLMPTIFFEHSTLAALGNYLLEEYGDPISKEFSKEHVKEFKMAEQPQHRKRFIEYRRNENDVRVQNEPIAIVGMAGKFPGAKNLDEYWANLLNGKDCIIEVPEDRWDWRSLHGDGPDQTKVHWGGFIEDVDKFDTLFFDISPLEAEYMDPQQRLFLECVWHTIEHAGYNPDSLRGSQTGLFVGVESQDYVDLLFDESIEGFTTTGTTPSILANRISFLLDLHGPSEPIATACSSSLVAVHRAVRSIRYGECTQAVAGGVNVMLSPRLFIGFSRAGMLSEDGRCKTFSKSANGYVRGEGVGAILLKPFDQAEKDGDSIYALIKGSAQNHSGYASSLTAPSQNAQSELVMAAYLDAGVDPKTVTYIETHGTGTQLGDPVEINGLNLAFSSFPDKHASKLRNQNREKTCIRNLNYCGLGSVKSNVGHLETAAGIAGLLKLVLQLKHKILVKTLHCDEVNPYINLTTSPFYIVRQNAEWEPQFNSDGSQIPRCGGVSSFGFGGANAHVVIEEYPDQLSVSSVPLSVNKPALIVLSAKTEDQLKEIAKYLHTYLTVNRNPETVNLHEMAYTLQVGRKAMDYRLGLVVSTIEELGIKLGRYLGGKGDIDSIFTGRVSGSGDDPNLLQSSDQERSQTIRRWVAEGRFDTLLTNWVRGLEVDWNIFYKKTHPHRISLPTYPFARERYWINNTANNRRHHSSRVLHPLVHENTSNFQKQQFTSTFSGKEFFLSDHQVNNCRVLPAVAYLEMARAAFEQASASRCLLRRNPFISCDHDIQLTNIVWIQPLVVTAQSQAVQIELRPTEGEHVQFEIVTEKDTEEEKRDIHSQGMVKFCKFPKETSIDFSKFCVKTTERTLTPEQCNKIFQMMGVEYGPAHLGIREIYPCERGILTKLSLPVSVRSTLDQYGLHPSLVDSAIQACLALYSMASSNSQSDDQNRSIQGLGQHKTILPFSLDKAKILNRCSDLMWGWIRYSGGGTIPGMFDKVDIDLYDDNGCVCCRLLGFQSRMVEKKSDSSVNSIPVNHNQKQFSLSNQGSSSSPLRTTSAPTFTARVSKYFKTLFSSILRLPSERIRANEPLEHYGIDSIIAMKLTNQLEKEFGPLSKTLFFEYQTINELADYFCSSYSTQLRRILSDDLDRNHQSYAVTGENVSPEPRGIGLGTSRLSSNFSNRLPPVVTGPLDIAIIGLSGRYPQAQNLEEYWDNLLKGKDCITEIPKSRWDWRAYFSEDKNQSGKHYSKWGGFIEDVDKFDPLFFAISPREAAYMDPQERLFLEAAWSALEDAGYCREHFRGNPGDYSSSQVGVYAGVMWNEYQILGVESSLNGAPKVTGGSYASIANRVSYALNLHGPSMSIDTMCSSSLTALHLACQDLKNHATDMGIAGGVNVSIHPHKYLILSSGQFISSRGHCESFGEGGDGYIPGEGVGVAILKRLGDAQRDGDHIYGLIRGSAINHGGKTNGFSVPNPNAQQTAIIQALKQARVNPRRISYVEAHGTGTKLGDPIEITGLTKSFETVLRDYSETGLQDNQFCWIGSAKSNIGHCESAAGIAGVSKVLLQLKYGKLVRSLHSEILNPNIDFASTPFRVNQKLRDWDTPIKNGRPVPRIASISSFGAGGSNAHIIIEEYLNEKSEIRNPKPQTNPESSSENPKSKADPAWQAGETGFAKRRSNAVSISNLKSYLIVLSAKNEDRLKEVVRNFHDYLQNQIINHKSETINLSDVAYTLQVGRESMDCRLATIVQTAEELKGKLGEFLDGNPNVTNLYRGHVNREREISNAFASEKEMQELLRKWIGSADYKNHLGHWCQGLNINWTQLYGEQSPRRISLPTYPFAKERYWATVENQSSPINKDHRSAEFLHSFLPESPSISYSKMGSNPSKQTLGVLMAYPEWEEQSLAESPGNHDISNRLIILCKIPNASEVKRSLELTKHTRVLILSADKLDLQNSFALYAVQIFEAIRRIFRDQEKTKTFIQIVVGSSKENFFFSGLSGLLRTANLENPGLTGQIIIVDSAETENGLVEKINLESKIRPDPIICYKNGSRSVRKLQEHSCKDHPFYSNSQESPLLHMPSNIPLKHGGVYLITGGEGGLGLVFAEEIVRQVRNVTIVLTGRSSYDEVKERKIKALSEIGRRVVYRQIDVTQQDSVYELIKILKESYGGLQGVIHSAGVVLDNFILKKDTSEFMKVLAPKVSGLVNLDHATKDQALDFFILFSSGAAAMGNIGQSDYACANGFMDGYANYRNKLVRSNHRRGQTLSINWPLWKEGGMKVDQETERLLWETIGMVPMHTSNGISAFYQALWSGEDQLMVIEGDLPRLRNFLFDSLQTKRPKTKNYSTLKPDLNPLRQKTIFELKKLLSKTIDLEVTRIDPNESLENYGIDSVMIRQMNKVLLEVFSELPSTVILEYQTINALANYLVNAFPTEFIKWTKMDDPIQSIPSNVTSTQFPQDAFSTLAPSKIGKRTRDDQGLASSSSKRVEPIAIIGMSGRYPQANNLDDFWENLRQGKSCIREIPKDRWPLKAFFDSDSKKAVAEGKSYSKWGGFLDDFAEFDPFFFNISPRDAQNIDPQERGFLMECWRALEDAGYPPSRFDLETRKRIGVFGGITRAGIRPSFASLVNRVSYFMDFKGPSIPVDTMCSSALVALNQACQGLHQKDICMALVGAVNLHSRPESYLELCRAQLVSTTARAKVFEEGGDGFLPSEGVGAVVLKRLADAEKDGDHIFAVIRGWAVNHSGKTNGYSVPSPSQQAAVIEAALETSDIDPRSISYIESAASGSEMADAVELEALRKVFQPYRTDDSNSYYIGSLKSTVGHGESVSGMAQLMKVVLQLKNKTLCPTPISGKLNPNIRFDTLPFKIQGESCEWRQLNVDGTKVPRRAGITSIGAGGVNAHIIVEEYDSPKTISPGLLSHSAPVVFVLSAKTNRALRNYLIAWKEYLEKNDDLNLGQIAYSVQIGREVMKYRFSCVVQSRQELIECIENTVNDTSIPNCYRGPLPLDASSNGLLDVFDENMIESLVDRHDFDRLAQLWTYGVSIPWIKLYKDTRIAFLTNMPKYPFSRKHYWPVAIGGRPISGNKGDIIPASSVATSLSPTKSENHRAEISQLENRSGSEKIPQDSKLDHPNLDDHDTKFIDLVTIRKRILEVTNKLLNLNGDDEFDDQANFLEMGFSSITIVTFIEALNERFNLELRQTAPFDYPTIEDMAKYIGSLMVKGNGKTESILATDLKTVEAASCNSIDIEDSCAPSKSPADLQSILSDFEQDNITIEEALELAGLE